MSHRFSFRNLARAFLAGPWSPDALLQRGGEACGQRGSWLRPLVRRVLAAFPPDGGPPEEYQLAALLEQDRRLRAEFAHRRGEKPRRIFWVPPQMGTADGIPVSGLPVLRTTADVAAWLALTPAELDWFAAPAWRARSTSGAVSHYSYCWLPKRSGPPRLIEAPKRRLKAIQRRILHDLLDKVPPHEAAHGYRRGRSVLTYTTPHAGRRIVLRFDLREFFPSVPASRVHALFRRIGYPKEVARTLTRLCTNATPAGVWELAPQRPPVNVCRSHETPHLPQGAPTSPALANLCAHRLDCRLAGLARAVGACYTRYADDLAFSGGPLLEASARRLHVLICRVALEERFEVHTRKTRFLRQGVRQQLAGVVLNVRPNVRRADYDRLKATLHNCLRHGPASQDRDGHADFRAHLLGRIAHVARLHPARGQKLRALFDRIAWHEAAGNKHS